MKTQKNHPNLIVKEPHPHKHLTVRVDDGNNVTRHRYLKKILIELPYPMLERMQEIKRQGEYRTMSDFIRHAVVKSGLISTRCIEDVGLTAFDFKTRDELRRMVPAPDRTPVKGSTKRTPVGIPKQPDAPEDRRQLVQ